MSVYQQRCKNFFEKQNPEKADAILIQTQPNMRYFSGFTGDSGGLLIGPDYRLLITDSRYTEQAEKQSPDYEVQEFKANECMDLLCGAARAKSFKCVGFEDAEVLYSQYRDMQAFDEFTWVPKSEDIGLLRIVKSEDELENMRKAGEIADRAFDYICTIIKPGMSEIDIALELEFFMRKNGADDVAFDPIVASGPNGSLPHAIPSARKVQEGDMITMDFGCKVNGYCSDMTRTVALGKLAPEQEKVYNICLDAQLTAFDAAKIGLTGVELDKVGRDIIVNAGYGDMFGHGLGHGVGLNIHEEPRLSPAAKKVVPLEKGMIITIEPGIYVKGFYGVRIEDFGVMTEKGFESFSHSPKELICISIN